MHIVVEEKIGFYDFLEANFPQVLQPFYTRRLFIINMAFAVLFIIATAYLYIASYQNHIRFESIHYMYLFFAVLFTFLAFYLLKREKKIYRKILDQINDLHTVYTIADKHIEVKNTKVHLHYTHNEITEVIDLPHWLVFEFVNGDRISIYKPNLTEAQLKELQDRFL